MVQVQIHTQKKHRVSPYLHMQFMEPLSVTDSSVDAAWDFVREDWFPSVIDKVRELAPPMVRFGGCFASYYHWREGIGPRNLRPPMINYAWSGIYHNQVGTHEFIDFCRRVNAEPMLVANMESEGLHFWAYPPNGTVRKGTAEEAADWVDYCNNPENKDRIANGAVDPFGVKYWQIGNETSYRTLGYDGQKEYGFDADQCVEVSARFAEAMRQKDPTIQIIGWGDGGKHGEEWGRKMSRVEGIDLLAFHHHFGSGLPDSPFHATHYRDDVETTWLHLLNAYKSLETRISQMRSIAGNKRLAMTEGHFALGGRNRNEVLSSWGAGVAYARCLNVLMRNSDVLDIATMADFFGNVWQVNAMMIPAPIRAGVPYLQPVGAVMSLFSHHMGTHMAEVSHNGALDAVCTVNGRVCYLHVANTDMHASQELLLDLGEQKIRSAMMYYIAERPESEITPDNPDVFAVKCTPVEHGRVVLPAAAVAAIEIVFED